MGKPHGCPEDAILVGGMVPFPDGGGEGFKDSGFIIVVEIALKHQRQQESDGDTEKVAPACVKVFPDLYLH